MSNAGEVEPHQELPCPGWQPLGKILNTTTVLFEKLLFLPGFEFSSNIYVLTGDFLTVVDPGNDYTAWTDLWRLGFQPTQIKKIVLTHGHLDQAMGAFELLRAYPRIVESGGFELVVHEAGPRELKEAVKQFGCRVGEVRGGESVELGGLAWEVIHTPGHTIDGICLYHAPSKTAFTGDTVLPRAMAEPDKNAGGRLDHYLFGIRALLQRDIENVLPGHGMPVAGAGRRVIEETYESLMMKVIGIEDKAPWLAGARELVQRGFLQEAVFCCDKQIAAHPGDSGALELKALCLNDLGQFQKALGVLDELSQRRPQASDDVFPLIGRGYALMGLGQYKESVQLFDDALKIRPGMKDALMYKAMALYLAGHYEEALEIEHFRREFVERFKEELLKKQAPP